MADDIQERLKGHARAFEGLMALMPAKHYYAQDNSDEWQKKKQTKEQRQAAKRANLDPHNHMSAKDVMDENDRKRKRGEDVYEDGSEAETPEGSQQLRESLAGPAKAPKKQKIAGRIEEGVSASRGKQSHTEDNDPDIERQRKAEKRKEGRQRKKEKRAKEKEKALVKKTRKAEAAASEKVHADEGRQQMEMTDNTAIGGDDEMEKMDVGGMLDENGNAAQSSVTPSPEPESPQSAISANPTASSSSSIIPPAEAPNDQLKPNISSMTSTKDSTKVDPDDTNKPTKIQLPKIDQEVLKARLQARIDALRAARKADGIDGKPAKNRQELLEARRMKNEQRKQRKKEMRKRAKEDEERAASEAELARLCGSGSPLGSDIFSPRREEPETNFSFGRVKFDDGRGMDPTLSTVINPRKKSGPQDPRARLEFALKKKERLNGLDEAKRADIEEKDLWLNAKKRAHGERVRDDTSLLKKTLKRKERAKLKSQKEWDERITGVKNAKEAKQRKREENLRKRKEPKGQKGKKEKKGGKKNGRPGFEGSFKGKTK
ncbi:surfeit locus protein 6-domain-containing protein [Lineolata rhizophorae]|uniref:Surfeit locus protein 6-domain-containing protein n=1 Tax=Lineolata rhizophorae TaxID=578093 RepID=A0A6A6P0N7_9PEZI|nr:surfeit locus protein 6-domain-containing protein [Lineolata rhizophorae]